MADEDNKPLQPTGLLDANALYFEEVEGEEGLELSLEEDQKLNLAGIIKSRFQAAEDARRVALLPQPHLLRAGGSPRSVHNS